MAQTIYCVQSYEMTRQRLAMGRLRQFKREDEARQVAEQIAPRVAGAIVYRISGEPEFDYWSEPETLATYGAVPGVT